MQGYLISLLNYYESGDFKQYKELFLTEYEHTIKQLQGVAPEQLEAQSKALKKNTRSTLVISKTVRELD